MQTIEITNLSGHSPYNISICDITYTTCYPVATNVVSAPITLTIPLLLQSSQQIIVSITDSVGCVEFQSHNCQTPSSTPTNTPTPTITPTNIYCNCTVFDNPTMGDLTFGYIDCEGTEIYDKIASLITLYVCGKLPYADSGVIITVNNPCVENSCPKPSQTPTSTPTPTPTLPPIVGYFIDCCDPTNEFTVSDIPISFSPLSGTYFINVDGFVGCVTSILSTSSEVVYSYVSMSTSTSTCVDCVNLNPFYSCVPLSCLSSIVPPTTINGIVITESFTGSVDVYSNSYTSCGTVTTPENSKWLGQSGPFNYQINFSVPVNDIIIFLTGAGTPDGENFIMTTNTGTGIPLISSTEYCYTTIIGNQIFSGAGADSGSGGGGGKFLIHNSNSFTSLTISGSGGESGALLSLCSNSFNILS